MALTSTGSNGMTAVPPDGGWAELAEGRWAAARDAFVTTLGSEETAEALEGLVELGAHAEARRARRLLPLPSGGDVPLPELTPREREVLRWIAEGLTNREIAERLVISEHTVHRHTTNILRKLDLPSRAAAAVHAVRSGLFVHPET